MAKGRLSKEAVARLRGEADKQADGGRVPAAPAPAEVPPGDGIPFRPSENVPAAVQKLWASEGWGKEESKPAGGPAKKPRRKASPAGEDPQQEEAPSPLPPADKTEPAAEAVPRPDILPPGEYDQSLTFSEGVSPARSRRAEYLNYYLHNNITGLDSGQVLELLLQFAIPYRNTEPVAAQLLERFGGLPGVLGAGLDRLRETEGVSDEAAALLDMVMRVARRSVEEQNSPGDLLNTDEKAAQYLTAKFYGMTTEALYLLCLDNTCRLISATQVAEGSSCVARVEVRQVIETALRHNAPVVILAHNHPGGRAYPSDEDIRATRRIHSILRMMDINLVDHFIIAGDEWKSMARMGELAVMRTRDL